MSRTNKFNKLLISILLITIICSSGCTNTVEFEEYEDTESSLNNNSNQYNYTYEIVDAEITYIDCSHWFAICNHYTWDIKVYCKKYKISYSEDGEDSGAFADIPYYFDKSEGDIVKLKVRKQYLKDDLYKIEAIEIVD